MEHEQEWSHFIESENIDSKNTQISLSAPKKAFSLLVHRLDLESIEKLSAELTIQRNDLNKFIHIRGKIIADIHQKCVVTGEPVAEHIDDEFEAWFTDAQDTVSFAKARRERMSRGEKADQPMIEEADDPEQVVDGKIDLGELVVQHTSLALNPYPRKDGATYDMQEENMKDAPEGTYDNPFAALKEWKAKETKGDS